MQKMPFHAEPGHAELAVTPRTAPTSVVATSDWRESVPVMTGRMVALRELQLSDAPSLLAMLSTEEVARFISPPPTSLEGFERFIAWVQRERALGNGVCLGVVPHGLTTAVGLFQVRHQDVGFATAEWGFALGAGYWGTGVFVDGATLAVDFAFDTLGVHRLEARAAVLNGRGNGALRKIGAVQEAILRRAFVSKGRHLDQVLWSILQGDWRRAKAASGEVQVH